MLRPFLRDFYPARGFEVCGLRVLQHHPVVQQRYSLDSLCDRDSDPACHRLVPAVPIQWHPASDLESVPILVHLQ
jgi:hypothetical protein